MFDIGFWELALIGVVALLVVGPERLPALARTLGFWLGKARRLMSSVREDIEREIRADEIRKMTRAGGGLNQIHETLNDTSRTLSEAARELSSDVTQTFPESDPRPSESPGPGGAAQAPAPEAAATRPPSHDER
jgi:sec-independent protein translocase protein TatB